MSTSATPTPTFPAEDPEARKALVKAVSQHEKHLRFLKCWNPGLADPEDVLGDLYEALERKVRAGCSQEQVKAAFSNRALKRLAWSALRPQQTEECTLDRFVRLMGPGHRRVHCEEVRRVG